MTYNLCSSWQINFQDLARRYKVAIGPDGNIKPTAGATVKEFLIKNNVNIQKFSLFRKSGKPVIRRELKRLVDKVTTSTKPTAAKLKEDIKKKIQDGKISYFYSNR